MRGKELPDAVPVARAERLKRVRMRADRRVDETLGLERMRFRPEIIVVLDDVGRNRDILWVEVYRKGVKERGKCHIVMCAINKTVNFFEGSAADGEGGGGAYRSLLDHQLQEIYGEIVAEVRVRGIHEKFSCILTFEAGR